MYQGTAGYASILEWGIPMADIRQRVADDQGILKKIQTFVPGFRGYRLREDLRDSDRMLRAQLAKKLESIQKDLENCRDVLAKRNKYSELDNIGGLISKMKEIRGKVSHAETGYSGLVADIEIKEEELNRLYEFDANMLEGIVLLARQAEALKDAVGFDQTEVGKDLISMDSGLNEFKEQFSRRMRVIEGTEV